MNIFLATDCPQLGENWWTVRSGIITASEADMLLTPAKGEPSKSQKRYKARLLAESCAPPDAPYFSSEGRPSTFAMQRGLDLEPRARQWYANRSGNTVAEVGFCFDDDFRWGFSPDGLIGLVMDPEPAGEYRGVPFYKGTAEGGLELKCPMPDQHMVYLLSGEEDDTDTLLREYKCQCNAQLGYGLLDWVDLVSFGDPAGMVVRVTPNGFTEKVMSATRDFHQQLEEARGRLLGVHHG